MEYLVVQTIKGVRPDDEVDKLHCAAAEAAEASEGRNVKSQQDLNDNSYGKPIKLIGGKNGEDGCAIVSATVEGNLFIKVLIAQGVVRAMQVLEKCRAKSTESIVPVIRDFVSICKFQAYHVS